MTDTAPDAAVQTAAEGAQSGDWNDDQEWARAICDALARDGWLVDPRRAEALEHIAETAQAYRAMSYDVTWSAFLCALDHFDTLTPATPAKEQP